MPEDSLDLRGPSSLFDVYSLIAFPIRLGSYRMLVYGFAETVAQYYYSAGRVS